MTDHRIETDSMGEVQVASDRYWGAQTERSIDNFQIGRGTYQWDRPIIRALGVLKKSAARANRDLGQLLPDVADLIVAAANDARAKVEAAFAERSADVVASVGDDAEFAVLERHGKLAGLGGYLRNRILRKLLARPDIDPLLGFILIGVRLSGITACECAWMTAITSGRAL